MFVSGTEKPVNKFVHSINNIECSTVRSKLRSGATEDTADGDEDYGQ